MNHRSQFNWFGAVILGTPLYKRRPCPSDIHQIKNKPDPVMSNDTSIIDLALANLLDVIPLITNTDENVDPALLRIYDRNAAIINAA